MTDSPRTPLSFWRILRAPDEAPREASALLAWLPLAGGAVGSLAAALVFALTSWSPLLAGAAGLATLRAIDAPRTTRLWLGLLALEALLILPAPPATQMLALVLAPTLGAWSRVVQCHGGTLAPNTGTNPLVARATFREFGIASVIAIGGALAVVDALGLVAVLAAVVPTLLLRAVLHRRFGGMPAWGPSVSARVAEASVIIVLALLSRTATAS